MAHFIEISVDGEAVELEIQFEDIYYKCNKCGAREYGGQYLFKEYEMRWQTDIPVDPQFLCAACAAEERRRTEPYRLAAIVASVVSEKAGKRLSPETALEWVEPWDEERLSRLEKEFVEQAKKEREQKRKKQVKKVAKI